MKLVVLPKAKEIELGGRTLMFDSKVQLIQILSVPANPQQGLTLDEVRKSSKILDKLEGLAPEELGLTLEDAEHAFLVDRLNNTKFTVAHRVVVNMVDAVVNAPDYNPSTASNLQHAV